MTGEQFLNSLRYLNCEITALEQARSTLDRTRQDILDRALSSPNLSGVCVQSMPGDKTAALGMQLAGAPTDEQLVQKLRQVQDKVNRKIDELVDRKRLALIAIDRIPDTRLRALLILRYVNTMGWDAINGLMGEDCVPLLPGAIEAFSAVYQS